MLTLVTKFSSKMAVTETHLLIVFVIRTDSVAATNQVADYGNNERKLSERMVLPTILKALAKFICDMDVYIRGKVSE